MATLNTNRLDRVLIPTNHRTYPFLIKVTDSSYPYYLVQTNGKLSGDGYSLEEVNKDFPNAELE